MVNCEHYKKGECLDDNNKCSYPHCGRIEYIFNIVRGQDPSQTDILKILNKNKWLTSNEIIGRLCEDNTTREKRKIGAKLLRLWKNYQVDRRINKRKKVLGREYEYRKTRKTRK